MLDADRVSIWLERGAEPALIRPYARAAVRSGVEYRVTVRREAVAGRSSVAQGGRQVLEPGAATSLGVIRVNRSPQDACTVEVEIASDGGKPARWRFECPPP